MCDVLDRVEKEGIEKGKKEVAINLLNQGYDSDFISRAVGVKKEIVEKWLELTTN